MWAVKLFSKGRGIVFYIKNSYRFSSKKFFDSLPSRHETSLRHLNQVSVERDISKTSQRHLKKDVFFETSLRHLKYISKKTSFLRHLWDVSNASQERCLFWDIFKTSRIHLQKDVFYVTSLRRLEYISKKMSFRWRLEDVSNSYQKRCITGAVQKGYHQVRGERSAQN